jgi:hypothetical protein
MLTLRARGPRDAGQVWERYVRPGLWPTWSPQIRRVECPADRLTSGVTGRVVGPLGLSAEFTVDGVDEGVRRWSWTVRRGPVRLQLTHAVAARDDGSETWLRISGALPVALGYAPAAQVALCRLVH